MRPDSHTKTVRTFLTSGGAAATDRFKSYRDLDVAGQKQLWKDHYQGVGWKASRVLEGLLDTPDFYMQEIAQVKASTWSKGRVVLVGDAAYCPSPMSGMGTSAAIVGAYVLAGSISKCASLDKADLENAYKEYESVFRPYVNEVQQIPFAVFRFGTPETQWGLTFMRYIVSWVDVIVKWKVAKYIFGGNSGDDDGPMLKLPEYKFT